LLGFVMRRTLRRGERRIRVAYGVEAEVDAIEELLLGSSTLGTMDHRL
jgi:hypothetical protein